MVDVKERTQLLLKLIGLELDKCNDKEVKQMLKGLAIAVNNLKKVSGNGKLKKLFPRKES